MAYTGTANSAPRMIPTSITLVMSAHTGAARALALPGSCQNVQLATSIPNPLATLAPHSANADVMPHGRPANARVA